MAVSVLHATLATAPDDPDYDVSYDEWNEGHDITGTAHATLGFDAAGAAVERFISGGAQFHTADVITASAANAATFSACALSSTQAFAVYCRSSDGYVMGVVIDKSGDTVVAGTPEVMVSANCNFPVVTALTSTKVAIAYEDITNTDLRAVIVTITGSDPDAPGTPVALDTTRPTGQLAICTVSSTVAAVSYVDGASFDASLVMFSVSGTTITGGTPLDFTGTFGGSSGVMFHDTNKITGIYRSDATPSATTRWKCSFSTLTLSNIENSTMSQWAGVQGSDSCAFAGPFGDTAVFAAVYTNAAQDVEALLFSGAKTAAPAVTYAPQIFAAVSAAGPFAGAKIDGTHAVFMVRGEDIKTVYQVTIDADGLLTVTNATSLNNSGEVGGLCYMETGQLMYVYADATNSDYPTARLLEVPQ